MPGTISVRPYRPGDEEAIVALHNRAFAGAPPRTLAHWRWKYQGRPGAPTHAALAEDDGGRCLAVSTLVKLRWLLDGREGLAGLQGDVAVDPDLGRTLGGGRVLQRVMAELYRIGAGPATWLDWGCPEPALLRLATRRLGVQVLRPLVFLVRERGAAAAGGPASVQVRRAARCGPDADALWVCCRGSGFTGTVRDAAYLAWRYSDHPDVDYAILEARDRTGDGLRGLAVVRAGGWHPEVLSLMEWLVPADDGEARAALLAAVLGEVAQRDRRWLVAWFTGALAAAGRWQDELGFAPRETPYRQCYRPGARDLSAVDLGERWSQSMGDLDFF